MSFLSRLKRLETHFGAHAPKHVMIWHGPQLPTLIERGGGKDRNSVHLTVRTPSCDADPMAYLTDEQWAEIGLDHTVTVFAVDNDVSDARLQPTPPPWRPRPVQLDADGRTWLLDESGAWRRLN